MKHPYPAFGICGYSGSGKTTVIEKLIARLVERGLKVGIAKHDVHGLNIDKEGKDTDRFFKAGADVIIRGPAQSFLRTHRRGDMDLADLLKVMGPYFDLMLVEGHKGTPLPQKVWLSGEEGDDPPDGIVGIQRVLRRDEDRLQIITDMIDEWLPKAWVANPVCAGIILDDAGDTGDQERWRERVRRHVATLRQYVDGVVLIGTDCSSICLDGVPFLNAVQDVPPSVAGALAALRWSPLTSWVFVSAGMDDLSGSSIQWLLDQRKPGVWAILPSAGGEAPAGSPLAYYDFRSQHLLEEVRCTETMAELGVVSTPQLPGHTSGSGPDDGLV